MNRVDAERPRNNNLNGKMKRISDPELIKNYLSDESKIIEGNATEVVFPRSEKEISEILKESNDGSIRVTVSGAGTGLTGSRVPMGGISLSMEELTQVSRELSVGEEALQRVENGRTYRIIVGKENDEYYAVVPPAIPLSILKEIIEGKSLFYPPDPTETNAFIGGTVATNASGARTFSYGPTRNYVRRLRIVMPSGDVLNIRRGDVFAEENKFVIIPVDGEKIEIQIPEYNMPNVEKNSAGYYLRPGMDFIDLFIGSEGTLGVFSEVEIKLTERPKTIVPIFAHFKNENDSIKFFRELRYLFRSKRLNVLSIEFFDSHSVDFIRQKYRPPKIPEDSRSIIDFELEVSTSEERDTVLEKIVSVLLDKNMLEAFVISENEAKEIRHSLPEKINEFIRSHGTKKVATDIAVPEDKFDEIVEYYREIGEEMGVNYLIFGHIGNNHLHFNFLPSNNEEVSKAQNGAILILKKAVELGGTITAEHGVGKKYYVDCDETKPLLSIMYTKETLFQISGMKRKIDPNCILNTGNIIPEVYCLSKFGRSH